MANQGKTQWLVFLNYATYKVYFYSGLKSTSHSRILFSSKWPLPFHSEGCVLHDTRNHHTLYKSSQKYLDSRLGHIWNVTLSGRWVELKYRRTRSSISCTFSSPTQCPRGRRNTLRGETTDLPYYHQLRFQWRGSVSLPSLHKRSPRRGKLSSDSEDEV